MEKEWISVIAEVLKQTKGIRKERIEDPREVWEGLRSRGILSPTQTEILNEAVDLFAEKHERSLNPESVLGGTGSRREIVWVKT